MINTIENLRQLITTRLEHTRYGSHPKELYQPIEYIMQLGGKRLRPLLTLLSYNLYASNPEEIIDQALAVEVFHNFTLMHDDIMDDAPLRRGQPTVHEKWGESTAILSGDVMLVKAYEMLLSGVQGNIAPILAAFNQCAAEVCEGQQMDMTFEKQAKVSEADYLEMIRLKTAVLLGFSLKLGAMLADAGKANEEALSDFGINVGIGFQLKDDLLDVYADNEKFGKQVGGDIIANKKTFLLIKALEMSNRTQRKELDHWLSLTDFDPEEKVKAVTSLYDELGIKALAESKMNDYFGVGFKALTRVEAPLVEKAMLRKFAEELIDRQH